MEDHLKRREENEVDEATAENKMPREENEKEDGAAEKKRPREENEEDEATAEKKRPREENEENLMSWTQPDIAATGISASPTTSVDVHNEVQAQQKQEEVRGNSSSINLFHVLRDRQLGEYDIKKLPNILPNILGDYHLQAFDLWMSYIATQLVMADDTICVIHYIKNKMTRIVPFKRQVDPFQISAFTDDDNRPIINLLPWTFENIYYNPHNNSLIMKSRDTATRQRRFIILSIEIRSIKARLSRSYKQLFQGESMIYDWDVDIPNCRCMIYNRLEKVFKFYELREYSPLFTIPVPSSSLQYQIKAAEVPGFTFGSPENMDMLIHQKTFDESILFRIYCKRNGKIRREFFLPLDKPRAVATIDQFVLLCDSDRMVVQLGGRPLDVVDISCENPVYIKRTNINATFQPYYLTKSSKFICYDCTIQKVRVCNLEGEILATLQDHPVDWFNVSFSFGSHITKSEDIIISVCRTDQYLYSINVSSILTGQCLAKISPDTANCSRIRQEALAFRIGGFAYDERTHEIFTTNNRGICCVWSNRFRNDVGNIDSGGEESDNS